MGSGIRRAVTVAGFAVAALALASCGDDETAGDEQTLTYFEGPGQPPEFFGPGTGPGGPPVPGGGVALSGTLVDADGDAVGDVNYTCSITGSEEGGDHVCTGLVDLPEGQLNIAYGGDIKGPPPGGSITGGTGDYAGATGTYEVVLPEEGPPPPVEEGQPPPPGEGPKTTFTFTLP